MVEEKVYKWRDASSKFVDAYIDWVRDTAKWLYPSDEVRSVPVLVSLPGEREREFLHALGKLLKRQIDPFFGVCSDLKSTQFTLMLSHNALELLRGAPQLLNLFIGSQLRTTCLLTPCAKAGTT